MFDLESRFSTDILHFDQARYDISQSTNEDALKILTEQYRYFKSIAPYYLEEVKHFNSYYRLRCRLNDLERQIKPSFIIESNPNFQINDNLENLKITDNSEIMLDWLVYMARKYLCIKEFNSSIGAFNNATLSNLCRISSETILKFCHEMHLNAKVVTINAGFSTNPTLYGGNGFHDFVVIGLDRKYAIDVSYRQFFVSKKNDLERIGIVDLAGQQEVAMPNCGPGIFMTMTPERLALAEQILKRGWFEITPENMKMYLDGFALSYRNGLYYEKTNDYSYTTPYTTEDYKKFNRKNSQITKEGIEVLGYQRTLRPNSKDLK